MYLCCLYTTNYLLLIEPYVPFYILCRFFYFARKCKIRHWPDGQPEHHLTMSIGPSPPSLKFAHPVLPTSCEAQLTGGECSNAAELPAESTKVQRLYKSRGRRGMFATSRSPSTVSTRRPASTVHGSCAGDFFCCFLPTIELGGSRTAGSLRIVWLFLTSWSVDIGAVFSTYLIIILGGLVHIKTVVNAETVGV